MNVTTLWQCFVAIFCLFAFGCAQPIQQKNDLPPSVDTDALVGEAIEWAHEICFKMRTKQQLDRSDRTEFTPFSLYPSPIPRTAYEQAVAVEKAMSLLYFRISCDFDFLKQAYKDAVEADESVRALMTIVEEVHNEGIKQPLAVFLQRSDYMITAEIDTDSNKQIYKLRQIEVNGGSVGTAGCMERLAQLHRRVLERSGYSNDVLNMALPENRSGSAISRMIYSAWKMLADPRAIILFLVTKDQSRWQFAMRYDEYELEKLSSGQVKIVYLTVQECADNLTLDDDFTLWLDGRRVGVVYMNIIRIGYVYTPTAIAVIRMIERSNAIKSTPLIWEMSSSKKIQQTLAMPGMVERFFKDPSEAQMVADIRATFANMWGLDNSEDEQTRKVIEDAIAHPERYVLKPNREGGGGNFWGQQIAEKLHKFSPSERAAHILMERIKPMITKNFMVWPMKPVELADVNNELGIYGYLLGNQKTGEVLEYSQPGNMVRTKGVHSDEGGVSSGNGVLDTPFLY